MKSRIIIGSTLVTLILGLLLGCSNELLTEISDDVARATMPKEPKIEVYMGATHFIDGSTYDFGTHPEGASTDVTFSIKNSGTGTLLLGTAKVSSNNESSGFSIQAISGTSVEPGASVNLRQFKSEVRINQVV